MRKPIPPYGGFNIVVPRIRTKVADPKPFQDSPSHHPMPNSAGTPQAKRRRLNFACNYCRNRKTRCDEQQPSCRACTLAGVECVTVNLRRPGDSRVERREAGDKSSTQVGEQPTAIAIHVTGSTNLAAAPAHGFTLGPSDSPSPDQDVSPKFTGRLPILRQGHARTALESSAAWLDLALHRLGQPRASFHNLVSHNFHPRQFSIRLTEPPRLPEHSACTKALQIFFDTVNTIFPLVDEISLREVAFFTQTYGVSQVCERYGLAVLMQLYMAVILGTYPEPNIVSANDVIKLRDYCKTLYGHVLGCSDLETVRASALAALCFKFEGNDMAAWVTLSQSLALADSVCMSSDLPQKPSVLRFEELSVPRKVWWTLYCFEELFALELGRSCSQEAPRDHDEHQMTQAVVAAFAQADSLSSEMFIVMTSLATTLKNIRTRCIQASIQETTSPNPENDTSRIAMKIQTTGECCLLLFKWAEQLPQKYSPTSDLLYGDSLTAFRNFIALQYNSVLLMLTRNSLLISEDAIWRSTEVMAKGKPWEHVIRNGQSIVAKAARKILMLACDAADSHSKSIMPVISITFHAAFVLYIRTIRHPQALLRSTDRMLIHTAISQIKTSENAIISQNNEFRCAIDRFVAIMDRPISDSSSHSGTVSEQRQSPSSYPVISREQTIRIDAVEDMTITTSTITRETDFPIPSVDVGYVDGFEADASPFFQDLSDQLGWDWAVFSELFPATAESRL